MRLLALTIYAASLHAGVLTFGSFSPVPGTEGAQLSGVLATFSDSNVADTAGNLSATINWGDSTTSAGIISGSNGAFSLSGGHTYAEEGSYTVQLGVQDGVGDIASTTGTEMVNDAQLTGTASSPFGFTANVALTNVLVLTFTDGDPQGAPSDYTATINWGDGVTSAGAVTPGVGNIFDVNGTHTYLQGGTFTVVATADDAGGSNTSATTTATGSSTPEPGTIGMVCVGLALACWKRMRRV